MARARETVGERSKGEMERGREKEGERVRASIWPGSVWEVKDSNVGYIGTVRRYICNRRRGVIISTKTIIAFL